MADVLFKDLLIANNTQIRDLMEWENYGLNTTVIPVVELIKDHSIMVLSKSYGKYTVDDTIIDEVLADVFINFPVLLQQLAITRLIDAYGVNTEDTNTISVTRTEVLASEIGQNIESTLESTTTDSNVLNTQQKTTGTVIQENESTNDQTSTTNIENSSGVQPTGSKEVNLSHNMPEQAINTVTGNFPLDSNGVPILTTSYVQTASENFSGSNQINTSESSDQSIVNNVTSTNDATTTNDITVADTGSTTRTNENSGTDNTESTTNTNSTNTVTETTTSTEANKQYALEIKAFVETAGSINAFNIWEDKFSWVIGIL